MQCENCHNEITSKLDPCRRCGHTNIRVGPPKFAYTSGGKIPYDKRDKARGKLVPVEELKKRGHPIAEVLRQRDEEREKKK